MSQQPEVPSLGNSRAALRAAARASYSRGGKPCQLESCVAFIDLLGATQILTTLTDDELHRLLWAVRDGAATFDGFDAYEGPARVVTFSDNIAACLPLDAGQIDAGVGWQVIAAGQFQRNLAMNGYFARGGITVGKVYADESTVLGPALVSAYKLESSVAVHPRVVLDVHAAALFIRGALEYPKLENSLQNQLVLYDATDDLFFVHYLEFIWEADDDAEVVQFLTAHRDNIKAQLHDPTLPKGVRDKYRWLAGYHNWFSRRIRRTEFLVPNVPAPRGRFVHLVDMALQAGVRLEDLQREYFGGDQVKR